MGAFEYEAVDRKGKVKKGILAGDTPRLVRQSLREQGLTPLSVAEVSGNRGDTPGEGRSSFKRGISPANLALLTRQLATMVRAGAVLGEALQVVAEQNDHGRSKKVLTAVRSRVMEGLSLATAMGDFPEIFPELYRATIEAGEHTGKLDLVLERLADYTEFKTRLHQKILLALAYPILLTVVALLVVSGLLTYVVPQVVGVFKNIDQQLPLITRIIIALSDFFRHYGLLLLIFIAGLLAGGRLLLRNDAVKRKYHRFLLMLPGLGRLFRALDVSRFARTFSILVASGVPVLEGMQVAAGVLSNRVMRESVQEAARGVREGKTIHQALQRSGYFPPMAIHLIASGEASSELDTMLTQVATSQESEVEMMTGLATTVFEPLLIILMGGMVLVIVLAVLMPVFELNQLVR
ncbi:MAG: type II secretion system inner membrane protein GspF [Proteobacteria bacterium]|nr:type II secretion system inner membrane protein GspF [Pseudomonadota bacterium]MBU1686370.1 type II secretion system inner membrane protein GspF [Pseudomonadota bacterium]